MAKQQLVEPLARDLPGLRPRHFRGDASGANNVGILLAARGDHDRALRWFRRAVDAGDDDTNLEIAKLHMARGRPDKAVPYLQSALRSKRICEDTHGQAARLLRRIGGQKRARR